jgi:hypothetical protein
VPAFRALAERDRSEAEIARALRPAIERYVARGTAA